MLEGLSALLRGGPKAKAAEPVAEISLSEPVVEPTPVNLTDDRRPVIEAEEQDEKLPMRSPARIRFLLETFEAGRPDRTESRIKNDQQRHLVARSGAKPMLWNRTHPGSFFGGQ
jgi:hypothetical protein